MTVTCVIAALAGACVIGKLYESLRRQVAHEKERRECKDWTRTFAQRMDKASLDELRFSVKIEGSSECQRSVTEALLQRGAIIIDNDEPHSSVVTAEYSIFGRARYDFSEEGFVLEYKLTHKDRLGNTHVVGFDHVFAPDEWDAGKAAVVSASIMKSRLAHGPVAV